MKVIVDRREQRPLSFDRWDDVNVVPGTLPCGDYALPGMETICAIERKSIDDLVGSLSHGRDRFERELVRARGYELFTIVVEASMQDVAEHKYQSKMLPHSVLQSLFAYQCRFNVCTIWAGNRDGAAYVTYSLLQKFLHEREEALKAVLRASGAAA